MKLTPAQKRALIRIAQWPVIGDGKGYHLSNGESIHNGVLCRLIEMGAVVPTIDGLFDGFSQSFVVAQ